MSGLMLVAWGVAVLALAKPLHVHWRRMLTQMRLGGVTDTIPGTRWFASEGGLRSMRIGGAVALAAGAGLLAGAGWTLLRAAGQP